VSGPYETEREASAAVQHILDSQPGTGAWGDGNRQLLEDACRAAGVQLGAYDYRIVLWLAGWEPATCAVVAGLITRAAQRPDAPGDDAGLRAMNQAIEAAVCAYFRTGRADRAPGGGAMIARQRAEDLLVWYIRHAWEAAGIDWESDNDAEVRSIVDAILEDTETRIRELEERIASLERSTPEARQAQYEADLAAADLAESGYGEDW
jgi:hypothetical protein